MLKLCAKIEIKGDKTWVFEKITACEIVRDSEAVARGMAAAIELTANGERLQRLSRNIASLAIADSADRIVAQIEKIW